MKQTTEKLFCDVCKAEIRDRTLAGSAEINGADYCPGCLENLYKQVRDAYFRLMLGEVPSRRGGYRRLGEYDS